jgi:uncharacterized membrane protein
MTEWIKAACSELLGLFVDDGRLAFAVLAWLGIAWLLFVRYSLVPALAPILLFVGLALILIESVLRASGKRGKS